MVSILNGGINQIIIGIIAGVIVAPIIKIINTELDNKSKFSREFIITAIFRINSFYSEIIRKVDTHSTTKYFIYEAFIFSILAAIYFKLILDYLIIFFITFALYFLIWISIYAKQYFKSRWERKYHVEVDIDLLLKRISHKYLLNDILSLYWVIFGTILTFYLLNFEKSIYYIYSFSELLFLLFMLIIIIFGFIIINFVLFSINVRHKIDYINIVYQNHQDDIIIRLVLTSNTTVTGKLSYINSNRLTLSHDGFKAIIYYKKIEFIETNIIENGSN